MWHHVLPSATAPFSLPFASPPPTTTVQDPARLPADVAEKHLDYIKQAVFVTWQAAHMAMFYTLVWTPLSFAFVATRSAAGFVPPRGWVAFWEGLCPLVMEGFVGGVFFTDLCSILSKKDAYDELATYQKRRGASTSTESTIG